MANCAIVDPNIEILQHGNPKGHPLQRLPSCSGSPVRLEKRHMSTLKGESSPRQIRLQWIKAFWRQHGRRHHWHPDKRSSYRNSPLQRPIYRIQSVVLEDDLRILHGVLVSRI